MNILTKLHSYVQKIRYEHGVEPKDIPLSSVEIRNVIDNECRPHYNIIGELPASAGKIFNIDVFKTPFAEQIRERRITVTQHVYCSEISVDESLRLSLQLQEYKKEAVMQCFFNLKTYITTDVTHLRVGFEWDKWKWLKEKLHITKWFPVKFKFVNIDCKVLYPYLDIKLPFNKHHVKFNLDK